MSKLNPAQIEAIEAIKATFHDVRVNVEEMYNGKPFVSASFTNGEENYLLERRFQVVIGSRGSITFISASEFMNNDNKRRKIMASLAKYDLLEKTGKKSHIKLIKY